jgi:hypothetical protein
MTLICAKISYLFNLYKFVRRILLIVKIFFCVCFPGDIMIAAGIAIIMGVGDSFVLLIKICTFAKY